MRLPSLVAFACLSLADPGGAGTIVVPLSVPTIQAAIAATAPGDTVLVAPGTYAEHDLVLKSGVTLAGTVGDPDAVTIDAGATGRGILCDGAGPGTTISGLTVTGGSLAGTCPEDSATGSYCMGGGLLVVSSSPRIERCVFRGNTADDNGGGVSLVYSSATFVDCRFEQNSSYMGGGISIISASFDLAQPVFERCVFEANSADVNGGAVHVFFAQPSFTSCTFRANAAGGDGAGIYSHTSFPIGVGRSILAFNAGGAIHCFDGTAAPVATCTNVFGNTGGDWTGCLAGQSGVGENLSVDPIFCDPDGGWLTLRVDSPCAPEANRCGLVGALGVGCGPVPLVETSWGGLKARYR